MKHRVELFTDGVFAIIITLLVLDLHPPEHPGLGAWISVLPDVVAYFVSFLLVGGAWYVTLINFGKFRDFTPGMIYLVLGLLGTYGLAPLMLRNLVEHRGDPNALLLYLISMSLGLVPLHVMRATAAPGNILDPEGWASFCDERGRAARFVWLLVVGSGALGYLHVWIGFVAYCMGMLVLIVRAVRTQSPARDAAARHSAQAATPELTPAKKTEPMGMPHG